MIWSKIVSTFKEFNTLSAVERVFVFSAMLCGFCITAEYAIIRPVSNSIFVQAYGADGFPYAWLAIVPLNWVVVSAYNRFLPRLGCFKMFVTIISIVMGLNVVFGLFLQKIYALPFIFYCWKEVYVLLMFQQLWSVIHSTMKIDRAKYLYGLFFASGGVGGVLGSMIPGFFAVKFGSERLLFLSLPIYGLMAAVFWRLVKNSGLIHGEKHLTEGIPHQKTGMLHGLKLIKSSSLLQFILLIVIAMQLVATLCDYQFNATLQNIITDKDLRTEYVGRVMGIVNTATVCFQLVGAFLLVHFLGLKRSHIFVPIVLALSVAGSLFFPVIGLITFSYITVKSFDFSLFGVIKEMLYIPMKVDEKFRAKAIIDVFAYRSSKAFGSLLILFFQLFKTTSLIPVLTYTMLVIFIAWVFIVSKMFKNYESLAELPALDPLKSDS